MQVSGVRGQFKMGFRSKADVIGGRGGEHKSMSAVSFLELANRIRGIEVMRRRRGELLE